MKRKNMQRWAAAGLALAMAVQLAGCRSAGESQDMSQAEAREQENSAEKEQAASQGPARNEAGERPELRPGGEWDQGEVQAPEGDGKHGEYDEEDLNAGWKEEEAVILSCNGREADIQGEGASLKDGVIQIEKAGTYVLRGSFEGQIAVDAGREDIVRLVLDGVQLSNSSSSPIYGIQSGKIILVLAEGSENTVTDGTEYVFPSAEEDEPDAAIFSKDDLTINGSGTLTVIGNYSNGIRSKDDLKVISGNIRITAVKDALKGKDSVTVKDGSIRIDSGEDGIKSNNDSDSEKGYVVIEGGKIDIRCGDDGIHAETWLTIMDGSIQIRESNEGLEGLKVDINGGEIQVTSSDDGINAAGGDSDGEEENRGLGKMQVNEDAYVRITGGKVRVNAMADGIDSNGHLFMEGGEVYISGPVSDGDGALDYNGTALISGGIFVAGSSAGIMQTFSQSSSQPMVMAYYSEAKEGRAELLDESGSLLVEYEPEKAFYCLLVSTPGLQEGEQLQLKAGNEIQELTVQGILTQVGERPAGRGFGHGGKGEPGKREGQNGEMPPGGPGNDMGAVPGGGERGTGARMEGRERGADASAEGREREPGAVLEGAGAGAGGENGG